jgi:hypothetical protein
MREPIMPGRLDERGDRHADLGVDVMRLEGVVDGDRRARRRDTETAEMSQQLAE